jgi:hypothetical protein
MNLPRIAKTDGCDDTTGLERDFLLNPRASICLRIDTHVHVAWQELEKCMC